MYRYRLIIQRNADRICIFIGFLILYFNQNSEPCNCNCIKPSTDCPPGWSGKNCEIADCSLVRYCSGHGMCLNPNVCTCDAGFLGEMCNDFAVGHSLLEREFSAAEDDWKRAFLDKQQYFPRDGRVTEWRIYGKIQGPVRFQVYRQKSKDFWRGVGSENVYALVGENIAEADGSGTQYFPIAEKERIIVKRGDIIGWRIEGDQENKQGVIDFDYAPSGVVLLTMTIAPSAVGSDVEFPFESFRMYSIQAEYEIGVFE